jgi:hypothetical protein
MNDFYDPLDVAIGKLDSDSLLSHVEECQRASLVGVSSRSEIYC